MEWSWLEIVAILAAIVAVAMECFIFLSRRGPKYLVSSIGAILFFGAPFLPPHDDLQFNAVKGTIAMVGLVGIVVGAYALFHRSPK